MKVGKRFPCHRILHPGSTAAQGNGTREVASGLVVRDYLAPLEEIMLEVKDYLAPLADFMLEVGDYLAPHVEFMLDVENDQVLGSNGVLIAIICFLG